MKTYIVTFESPDNFFKGKLSITAKELTEAQDKFFIWLKQQSAYTHLWGLTFSFELIQGVV